MKTKPRIPMGTRNESGFHATVEQGEGGTPLELFRFSIDPFDGWVAQRATGAKLQRAKIVSNYPS
jgi:hypothetical protein